MRREAHGFEHEERVVGEHACERHGEQDEVDRRGAHVLRFAEPELAHLARADREARERDAENEQLGALVHGNGEGRSRVFARRPREENLIQRGRHDHCDGCHYAHEQAGSALVAVHRELRAPRAPHRLRALRAALAAFQGVMALDAAAEAHVTSNDVQADRADDRVLDAEREREAALYNNHDT